MKQRFVLGYAKPDLSPLRIDCSMIVVASAGLPGGAPDAF